MTIRLSLDIAKCPPGLWAVRGGPNLPLVNKHCHKFMSTGLRANMFKNKLSIINYDLD